jgi:hypothetical protein
MSGNTRKNQVTGLVTLRHRSTMSGALSPPQAERMRSVRPGGQQPEPDQVTLLCQLMHPHASPFPASLMTCVGVPSGMAAMKVVKNSVPACFAAGRGGR